MVNDGSPPSDEYDSDPEVLFPRGCSNIFCDLCKHRVKHIRGATFAVQDRSSEAIAAMYDHERPESFRAQKGSSAYFCRCRRHVEFGMPSVANAPPRGTWNWLDDDDVQLYSWRCAGHPILDSLPTMFDGVQISRDTIDGIAARALQGWTPAGTNEREQQRSLWLARLFHRLSHTEAGDDMMRIVFTSACDPNLEIRMRAVHFLGDIQSQLGAWEALKLLSRERDLFVRSEDRLTEYPQDRTLEDALWRASIPLVGTPQAEYARQTALSGESTSTALFQVLARHDTTWFMENVAALTANAGSSSLPCLRKGLDWLPDAASIAMARTRIDEAIERRRQH